MDDPRDPLDGPIATGPQVVDAAAAAAAPKKKRGRRGGKGPLSKTEDTSATQKLRSGVAVSAADAPSPSDQGAVREGPPYLPDTPEEGPDEKECPSASEAASSVTTKKSSRPKTAKGRQERDVSSIFDVLQKKRCEPPRGKDALLAACLLDAALSGRLGDLDAALDNAKDPAKLEEQLSAAWQELAVLGVPLPFALQKHVVSRLMDLRFLLSAKIPAPPAAAAPTAADGGGAEGPAEAGDAVEGPAEAEDAAEGPAEAEDAAEGPAEAGDAAEGPAEAEDAAEGPAEAGDAVEGPAEAGDAVEAPAEAGGEAAPSHAEGPHGGPRVPKQKSPPSAGHNAASPPKSNKDKKSMMNAEKQVQNLLTRIDDSVRYCEKVVGVDDQAVLLLHFVVQEMDVKHLMKSTYNVLPWEELEFLLVRFVGIHSGGRRNLVDELVLTKTNLLHYLETFRVRLRLKTVLDDWRTKDNNYPKEDRKVAVRELRKECPMIYNDYDCLRDIDSLLVITAHLRVAQEENTSLFISKNVLEDALQTSGEFLKNTWMCPRLSQKTLDKISLIAPDYTGETLRKVRDKLAKLRVQSEEFSGSLSHIQSDLAKVERSLHKLLAEIEVKAILFYCVREFQNGTSKNALAAILSYLSLDQPSGVGESNIDEQLALLEHMYAVSEPEERKTLENVKSNFIRDAMGPDEVYRQYRTVLENILQSFSRNEASNVILALSISTKLKQLNLKRENSMRILEEIFRVMRPRSAINGLSMFKTVVAAGNIRATEGLHASYSADNPAKTNTERLAFVKTCIVSLRAVLSDPRAASVEFLMSPEGAPVMSAARRVLLDIATVWHEGAKPRAVTDVCSPVLFGRPLRNFLAHGNDMLTSVPRYQPCLELSLLAGKLAASDRGPAVDLLCGAAQRSCRATARNQLWARLLKVVADKCDLVAAAGRGDVDAVREGLRQAPRLLEARDGGGRSLLHHAAASGSAELVRQLLEAGATMGADHAGETPLHCAASDAVAKALHGLRADGTAVDSGWACNAADHRGRLPLHAATASRRRDVVQYLLTVPEVDINAKDRSGRTALHLAVELDDVEMVDALLRAGASALVQDDAGQSPLHLAAATAGLDVLSALVAKTGILPASTVGTELDPRPEEPRRALGPMLAVRDKWGMTPLLAAAAHGNGPVLHALLQWAAPLPDTTADGLSALHLAARCGSAAVVNLIGEVVASAPDGQNLARSLMSPDTAGYLPLHYAAEFGHLEVVRTLCGFPLGPWPVFDWISDRWTALHLAAMHGHDQVVSFLVDLYRAAGRGLPEGPQPPMCLAALYGHASVLATLSGCGGVDVVDEDGHTPLHLAAEHGEEAAIEVLLAHGARQDAVDEVLHYTPLHLAARNGHVGAVRLLLGLGGTCDDVSQGPDILTPSPAQAMRTSVLEAEDSKGRTPLMAAVEHGAVLDVLLEAGADWKHVDDLGQTALARATLGHHCNNARKLLKFVKRREPEQLKEFVNRTCKSGHTALCFAACLANAETIRLLVEYGADLQIAPPTSSVLIMAVASCYKAESYDHVRTLLDLTPGYANVVFRHKENPFPPLVHAINLDKDLATMIAERCVDLHKEEKSEDLLLLAKMGGIEKVVAILEEHGVTCHEPYGVIGGTPASVSRQLRESVLPRRDARPDSGDSREKEFLAHNLKEAIRLQDTEELLLLVDRDGVLDMDLGGGVTALDMAFDGTTLYNDEVMAIIVEALTVAPGVCKPLLEARRLVPRGRETLLELAVKYSCERTAAALLRAGFAPEGRVGPFSLLSYTFLVSRDDTFHLLLRYAARPPGQVLPDEVPDKNACCEVLAAETVGGVPLVIYLGLCCPTERLEVLLDYGVSPNTRSCCAVERHGRVWGDSALLNAAKKGDADKVELLLARGADPLQPDMSGLTPLQLAAVYGHPAAARVLVRHQPDLVADAVQGLPTSVQLAAVCAEHKPGCREVFKVLCDASEDKMPALIKAAKEEARAILIESGLDCVGVDQYIAKMRTLSMDSEEGNKLV